MKKQNTYSGKFKLKVVLEALQANQPISAIASKYQITPKNIHNWKKYFIPKSCKRHHEYFEHDLKVLEKNYFPQPIHPQIGL